MLEAGHLASFNLQIDTWFSVYRQNSEIVIVTDVRQFGKAPACFLANKA